MCGRLRIVCLAAKPGKANGNAATNRAPIFPVRFLADKENLVAARGFPGSYLRAVQIDFRRAEFGCDQDFSQVAMCVKPDSVGNHEGLKRFFVHKCNLIKP